MGVALDRWLLPPLLDAWIDRLRRMGDERSDDAADINSLMRRSV